MKATLTPIPPDPRRDANHDVIHVPGLAPFVLLHLRDTEGSQITLEFWQPATLAAFIDLFRVAARELALEMGRPNPQEEDLP